MTPPPPGAEIALIGDLHRHWDERDVAYFNGSDYDLLLFIGDLGDGTVETDRRIAQTIAKLEKPALIMPGNNDAEHAALIEAELHHQQGLGSLRALVDDPAPETRRGASSVEVVGFCTRVLMGTRTPYTMVCGRPYAMGGGELSYARFLDERFGVDSMERSTARLLSLVDGVETRDVLFVAHQGPFGLGEEPEALWSCDFLEGRHDWGDPDLRAAIDHARTRGLRVLGVLAGHMHHGLVGGGTRRWVEERDSILYVNPARVPRIFSDGSEEIRHHVAITVGEHGLRAEERRIGDGGDAPGGRLRARR